MKKVLTFIVALFFLSGIGYAQPINTFPYTEGFEEGTIPANWTQEQITGTVDWGVGGTDYHSIPNTTHSGSHKARIYALGGLAKTRLSTPSMDLSGVSNPWLKFWHTQRAAGAYLDVLRVYYKTSVTGAWILLEEYTGDVYNWTERIIVLPNPSADYYIGFEGDITSLVGNGVQLDDVVITAAPEKDINSSAATLAFGEAFNNFPAYFTKKAYTIVNNGSTSLNVSFGSASPEITVEGLPITVDPLGSATITATLDASTLHTGDIYNGSFVLASDDADTPEFTVATTATIKYAPVDTYLDENFGDINNITDMMGLGWTYNIAYQGGSGFKRNGTGGVDNSGCLKAQILLYSQPAYGAGTVTTPYVAMGTDPKISFKYKINSYTPGMFGAPGTEGGPARAGVLAFAKALISKDNGVTWDEFEIFDADDYEPAASATEFRLIELAGDLSAYADQICRVQFHFQAATGPGSENVIVSLDDIKAGTERVNELAAVSVTGSTTPIVHQSGIYKVTVTNYGTAAQESYTVKLMQEDGSEIASASGVAINQGETKEFEFEWIPVQDGITYIYGEVELTEDEYPSNNKTDNLKVTVPPSTLTAVTIGTGTTGQDWMPYNTFFRQSLTQSLYYPDEFITNGGEIQSLIYKANFLLGSNILQNVPVQIWMGETDQESLENGWIDLSTLTEVFDGTLNLSKEGAFDVIVPLTTPYEYQGGILVVYSYRKDSDEGQVGSYFVCTSSDKGRSRVHYTDFGTLEPDNPPSIEPASSINTVKYGIPNTIFMMNMENTGSLSGVVDNGSGPLNNATVRITGSALSAVTDTEGKYKLPYVQPGEYEIEINRTGYETKTHTITIAATTETTQNVTLVQKASYTVSGKITGSNAPTALEGVEIIISGYENYSTTTNASGNYSIPGVYGGYTYDIQAKASGYHSHTSTVSVTAANVTNLDFMLNEYAYIALNPVATDEGANAIVSWEAAGGNSAFRYDNGILTGHLGFRDFVGNIIPFPKGVMGSAHRTGATLNNMSWYLANYFESAPTTVNLFVFELNEEGLPTANVIYSALGIPSTRMEWNTHEFPEPVEAPNGFYIAISHPTGFLSIGTATADAEYPFPAQTHFYSMDYSAQEYTTFETASLNVNLMIRAEGMSMGKITNFGYSGTLAEKVLLPTNSSEQPVLIPVAPVAVTEPVAGIKTTPTSASTLVGYVVYRLTQGQPEASWTELATVTATTYTDTDWSTLSDDVYQYAVKAEYAGNNLSPAVLTNELTKVNVPPVLTNVTVNGASITAADNMYYMAACNETSVVLQLNATGVPSIISGGSTYSAGAAIPLTGEKTPITIKLVAGTYTVSYTLTASQALGSAAMPMYVQRWGKTLAVVNNPANNGGHAFNEYKWYHNGILQDNDHGYILLNNRPATEYAAEVNSTKTGVWHKLCPNVKSQVQNEIVVYPNPVGAGQLLNLNLPEGTDKVNVRIYDMSGNLIRQQNGVHSAVTAPNQAGVYVIRIELPDGNVALQNILVE